jgi:hypothetical protein
VVEQEAMHLQVLNGGSGGSGGGAQYSLLQGAGNTPPVVLLKEIQNGLANPITGNAPAGGGGGAVAAGSTKL